jgi:branched-subunit amino acid aminotransferase/4-amino-4-deoxychorismate lyase
VMQAEACRRLEALGFSIRDASICPAELARADAVLLTNALMGAVPASRLDDKPLKWDQAVVDALKNGFQSRFQMRLPRT